MKIIDAFEQTLKQLREKCRFYFYENQQSVSQQVDYRESRRSLSRDQEESLPPVYLVQGGKEETGSRLSSEVVRGK